MAYSEPLAARVRAIAGKHGRLTEKRMFGGLAFLEQGRMVCGVLGDELVVRVGADAHAAALSDPHVKPMDFTGRPMKGFVYVSGDGLRTAKDLKRWFAAGLAGASGAKSLRRKKSR